MLSAHLPETGSGHETAARRERHARRRADVLRALAATGEFVSAQGLYARMTTAGARVGLSTVYRALATLAAAGQADSIREENGTRLFRHRPGPQHRHYLVCRDCGHSEPLETGAVEEWAGHLAATSGYTQLRHTLEVDGICDSCTDTDTDAGIGIGTDRPGPA